MTDRTEDSGNIQVVLEGAGRKIVVFACTWCALIGADGAGKKRISLPATFRVIPVECISRVEADAVIRAFTSGIDGVAVMGCHLGGCRHNGANLRSARKLELLKPLLDTVGIDSRRLFTSYGTAHEYHQFAQAIESFCSQIGEMPPVSAWSRSFVRAMSARGENE
ncbi:MAG TPA: hydrogenase iron-sulfur subunit [Deltaproteobacteria bacterium]|nr:hydrogenase iron-sulfur subunit [Deltaproteobacteria bacterium]